MIAELLEFVRREFELEECQADGATLRDHLVSAQRQTGEVSALLAPSDVCDEVKYIYTDYFLSMNRRRTGNGYGPNPLAYLEVKAWQDLYNVRLAAFELDALDQIDAMYVQAAQRSIAKRTKE